MLRDALKAVPEYCWLSRLVSRIAWNQGASLFPIALQTVLGDALILGSLILDVVGSLARANPWASGTRALKEKFDSDVARPKDAATAEECEGGIFVHNPLLSGTSKYAGGLNGRYIFLCDKQMTHRWRNEP